MSKSNERYRRITYTLFEECPADKRKFAELETALAEFEQTKYVAYHIYGHEICPTTGKNHLQGYMEFNGQASFKTIKKYFPSMSIRSSKGNVTENQLYCRKDEDGIHEFGEPKVPKSKKTDLPPVADPMVGLNPYPWQVQLDSIIGGSSNDRFIHWYSDPQGNSGKTTWCKSLCIRRKDVLYVSGKSSDIKFAITSFIADTKDYPVVILLDFTRSLESFISYEAIEAVKNGIFFSGKYESKQCVMPQPHVIAFSNFYPKTDSMTSDRWKITELSESKKKSSNFDSIQAILGNDSKGHSLVLPVPSE